MNVRGIKTWKELTISVQQLVSLLFTTQQTQTIMLRHCSTTTATGPMLPCQQDVAMILKQEETHGDAQLTIQRYEFHFTSIQRTISVLYFECFENFIIHEIMLLQLQEQKVSEASDLSLLFSDRKSTENRMTKRIGFYKSDLTEVCEVYRFR